MKTIGLILLASACMAQAPTENSVAPVDPGVIVPSGTRIPLQLINRISTKNAHEGDQVYLQTAFPIVVHNRIIIPPNSYVKGTITQAKRPGRVAGKGELYLRFDSLTLPNGVTREFRAVIGGIDGSSSDTFEKKEGRVVSDGSKGKDMETIAVASTTGAGIGAIAASSAGHSGLGAGIGAGAGLAAGLITVLLTRGPDAVLERGSTVDMVLDRDLNFHQEELMTGAMQPTRIVPSGQAGQGPRLVVPSRVPIIPE